MFFRSIVVLSIFMASTGFAQRLEPVVIEDALKMQTFVVKPRTVFSPDGRWVVFTVLGNDRPKIEKRDAYVQTGVPPRSEGDIWVSNVETEEARNLTGGRGANFKPSWSPDSHYLGFLSDRDGSGQTKLWLWDSVNNDLRMASNVPIRASFGIEIDWLPDSKKVLVTTVPEGLSVHDYTDRVWTHPLLANPPGMPPARGSTVMLYEAGRSAVDGKGTLGTPTFNLDELYLHDLALVDVAKGEAEFVVRGRRIERFLLSPDGSQIAFVVPKRFYKPGSYRRYCDLVSLNLRTRKEQTLASDILLNDSFSWSPDSLLVAYAIYGSDERSYEVYVIAGGGGRSRRVAVLPHETSDGLWLNPLWDKKGEYTYVILDGALQKTSILGGGTLQLRIPNRSIKYALSQREGEIWTAKGSNGAIVVAYDDERKQDGFYWLDVATGKTATLLEVGQCYSCSWRVPGSALTLVSHDGERIAFVAEDAQHAPDLWVSDAGFTNLRQLTHLNPQLERYQLGSARIIDWLDDDGYRLHGALLLPPDYRNGERYPLIVWVYPGASESNDFDWFSVGTYPGPLNMQLFATRGYAVLFPDEREKVGRRLEGLVKSVLPGVNRVIDMGIADAQRIGVMGHSQGGFAALGLVVETNRFKAAMAADGWGDSTAFYGVMDADGSGFQNGQAERQLGGVPWDYPLTYIQNSPMYFLDRLETPLLLVHGSEDDALPSILSDQVFVGLRRLGRDVEYARYGGESHVPSDWSYDNQVDLARRALAWFEKYLKGNGPATQNSQSAKIR